MNIEARLHELLTTEDLARKPSFPLGTAIISPSTRTINASSKCIDVEPRVMQVLVVLAEAAGAVVTRDTLFRRCWGVSSVTDDSLNRAIASLRRIASSTEGAFDVETIPRTGYRLVAQDTPCPQQRPTPFSRRRAIAAGAAALVAAAGGWSYRTFRTETEDPRVTNLVARSDQLIRNGAPAGQPVELLEKAVSLQPTSAEAWGRLALARCALAENASPDKMTATIAGTQDAARQALALNERSSDALAALALLPPYYGDWSAAEFRMKAVLAEDPDHLPTRDALAFMYAAVGREHLGSADRVRIAAREPLHVVHQFKLVYALWILGDITAADRAADRAMQLWPQHSAVWFARLWTLAFTGRPDRALAHINDSVAPPKLLPDTIAILRTAISAMITRTTHDVSRAGDAVLKLLGRGPTESVSAVMLLAGLGDIDRAFGVASAYFLERGPLLASIQWRPGQLSVIDQHHRKTNMLFLPVAHDMQADPRFMRLMKDIGLVRYWDTAMVEPDFVTRQNQLA